MDVVVSFEAQRRRGFPWVAVALMLAGAVWWTFAGIGMGWDLLHAVLVAQCLVIAAEAVLEWGIAFGSRPGDLRAYEVVRYAGAATFLCAGALFIPHGADAQRGWMALAQLAAALLIMAMGVRFLSMAHRRASLQAECMQPVMASTHGRRPGAPRIVGGGFMESPQDRTAEVRLQFA